MAAAPPAFGHISSIWRAVASVLLQHMRHAAALLVFSLFAVACGGAAGPEQTGAAAAPSPTVAIAAVVAEVTPEPTMAPAPTSVASTPTPAPTATPTPPPTPEQAPALSRNDPAFPTPVPADELLPRLEEAYRAALDTLVEIQVEPDPDDPRLADVFFAFGLLRRQEYLRELVETERVVLKPQNSGFAVHALDLTVSTAGGAIATFCLLDDTYSLRRATGETWEGDGARFRIAVDFAWVDGRWKVSDEVVLEREDLVMTCDGW